MLYVPSYVIHTLEELVAEDYVIIYFHGSTPRRQMPGLGWLKRCYQSIDRRSVHIWPFGKLTFECQKIAKNLAFKKKKIVIFFNKIANGNFVEKMTIFVFFFLNVKFLAIFWHSNGNFPEGQIHTTMTLTLYKCHCCFEFCLKNDNFVNLFFKCKVFGNFLTLKWQFSGGSGQFIQRQVHRASG